MSDPAWEVCEQCRHWRRQKPTLGQCRRYPPQVQSLTGTATFPNVGNLDFCGEFDRGSPPEPAEILQWPIRKTTVVTDGA